MAPIQGGMSSMKYLRLVAEEVLAEHMLRRRGVSDRGLRGVHWQQQGARLDRTQSIQAQGINSTHHATVVAITVVSSYHEPLQRNCSEPLQQ